MKSLPLFTWGVSFLIFLGCNQWRSHTLQGTWNATMITEGFDTVEADLSHVRMFFQGDHFVFQRTAIDSVQGKYTLKDELLIMICDEPYSADTLRVQVIEVDPDRMALRMNSEGAEQIVHLLRK